jgi:hypothetical protein
VTGAAGPEPPGLERDLGAIRRSEELIEMLASRSVPAGALTDPALAVLSRLIADVDTAACPAAPCPAAPCPAALGPAGPARHGGAWPHAAAAAAVAAAIATLTAVAAAALLLVGMCARLSAAHGRTRRPRC